VSFAAINLCVASQRVYIVDFVIDSVRKLLDKASYVTGPPLLLPYVRRTYLIQHSLAYPEHTIHDGAVISLTSISSVRS